MAAGNRQENGISLCPDCHVKAEADYMCEESYPEYSSEKLYELIGSNYHKALRASKKLK